MIARILARLEPFLAHRYLPLHVALLALLLALPSLWFGLQVDDLFHRAVLTGAQLGRDNVAPATGMFTFVAGEPEQTRAMMDLGFMPWYTHENLRLNLFRPVTVFTHWLDYRLWPDNIVLMHVHSLLWFAGMVILAALIYRRFMGMGWVAGLAALLYAIDDAHGLPAAWIANRNGLIAAFFGFATLLLHHRWRSAGYGRAGVSPAIQSWGALVLALGSLLLGVLSNEGAIAACAYLFAYAVFLDRGTLRQRALSLAPYAILIILWRIVYNELGYGTWGSEEYTDPVRSPLRYLEMLWIRLPILMLGQWAGPPADIFIFLPALARTVLWILAVVFLVWLAVAMAPVVRRNRVAAFWTLGMLLSLLPIAATFPMDRLLLFVGLGAMGLLALFIQRVASMIAPGAPGPMAARPVRALFVVLVIMHLIVAPVAMPIRIQVTAMLMDEIRTAIDDLPLDDDITGKTVVVTNAPNVFMTSYGLLARSLQGKPLPARLRSFAPEGLLLAPIRLTRTDERTIVAEPGGGYRWFLVRDSDHPLAVGDRIELTGTTIEVLELAPEGWPAKVAFTFDVPLEDPSLVWLKFAGRRFAHTTPPPIGEPVVLRHGRNGILGE